MVILSLILIQNNQQRRYVETNEETYFLYLPLDAPVFMPLRPCCVTGRSDTFSWAFSAEKRSTLLIIITEQESIPIHQ